ncbi:hypothetical protein LguiB_005476 [Lonicera macranthoides]
MCVHRSIKQKVTCTKTISIATSASVKTISTETKVDYKTKLAEKTQPIKGYTKNTGSTKDPYFITRNQGNN